MQIPSHQVQNVSTSWHSDTFKFPKLVASYWRYREQMETKASQISFETLIHED
jgi:hypothetical protein